MVALAQRQYERLLDFRTGRRRFLRWSADQVGAVGMTAAQHQLLLAVRGHHDTRGPTIGGMAGYLQVGRACGARISRFIMLRPRDTRG